MTFRQAKWDEPLVFELGWEGRIGFLPPELEEDAKKKAGPIRVPPSVRRERPPALPELSEVEVVRHFVRLSQMAYGVDNGPVPLGSCTMKYNPKIAMKWSFGNEKLGWIHPLQSEESIQGLLEILYELQKWLAHVVGMDECSLHPAAGAHGELAGVLMIRKYHELRGEAERRTEIIIPDSAHGTNPASAAMAGFRVVVIPSAPDGGVDVDALRAAVSERTAGLMLTNPNTLGLFESRIREIAGIVHERGGLLYYDGANLNGTMGYARPGDFGFDIAHINIHKTFSSPHGGGGPGAGPVCAKRIPVNESRGIYLTDLLPGYVVYYDEASGLYRLRAPSHSIGALRAFFGNVVPLVWSYIYMLSMGNEGLKLATQVAVLNTNYFLSLMRGARGYELPYDPARPRKHEAVISARPMAEEVGVTAEDVAKNLLDEGLYAPTIYFPLIVKEALMVEFTESETKENIDKYAQALKRIAGLAYEAPEKAKAAPRNTSVGRLDLVKANHPMYVAPTWRVAKKKGLA